MHLQSFYLYFFFCQHCPLIKKVISPHCVYTLDIFVDCNHSLLHTTICLYKQASLLQCPFRKDGVLWLSSLLSLSAHLIQIQFAASGQEETPPF